jgi:hypothetical protein
LGNLKTWVTKVDTFASEILGRLVRVETRLDHMDTRLDNMDARLDRMDARLDRMDARLDGIDTRLEQMTSAFHKSLLSLTLRLTAFVCGFGTTLVMATYFVATHAK